MLSPKSRYSRLNQNPASPSTDHDSDSSELHQVIRKEGGNDESYGRAHPPFCTYHFLMPVCAALAIAIVLTAGGIGFHFGRESIVSPSNIHVEAEGSEFYLSMSLPGRDQALSSSANLPPPRGRFNRNKFWRNTKLTGVLSRDVFIPMTVSPKIPCPRKLTLHGCRSSHVSQVLNYDSFNVRPNNWDINLHSECGTRSASRSSPKYFWDRHVSRTSLPGTPSLPRMSSM